MKDLIRESNLIEGISRSEEIDQSLLAWEFLQQYDNLSHHVILRTQKIITNNQKHMRPHWRGYYRDMAQINVQVGEHIAPEYQFVKSLMDNWLLDYDAMEPFEAHKRFEYIHPFVDGNGRTGRMLMWWQELKLGQKPTMIESSKRWDYYRLLNHKSNRHQNSGNATLTP